VLVAFIGLTSSAWATFGLVTLIIQPVSGTEGHAYRVVHFKLGSYGRVFRARWKQSRVRVIKKALKGSFFSAFLAVSMAYFAAVSAAVAVSPSRYVLDLKGLEQSASIGRVTIFLGATGGLFTLGATLCYMTRTSMAPRWFLPPVLPLYRNEIGLAFRARFLRSVFLFVQLRGSLMMAVVIGVMQVIPTSSDPYFSVAVPPRSMGTVGSNGVKEYVYVLVWIVGFVIMVLVMLALDKLIRLRMPTVDAALALNKCLNLDARVQGNSTRRSGIVDHFGRRRDEVARAANILSALGNRIDLARHRHPIATLVYGCADYLREYLSRTKSLEPDLPETLIDVLRDAVNVVAGAARTDFLQRVGKVVNAFDDKGDPQPSLRAKPLGRWASLVTRLGDVLDRYTRLINAIWVVFIFAVVTVLIITGDIDLTRIQIQR
jgi:hypothetical protein